MTTLPAVIAGSAYDIRTLLLEVECTWMNLPVVV